MCLSSLPGLIRALSRTSARLVEASTMTWSVVPIPAKKEQRRRFSPSQTALQAHSGLEAGDGVHSFTQPPFGAAEAECPLQLGAKSGRNIPGHTGQSLVTMDNQKSPFHLLAKYWLKAPFSLSYCHTWKLLQLEPRTESVLMSSQMSSHPQIVQAAFPS